MAYEPMSIPSRIACGSPSSTVRSMYEPGAPSSALHTTYLISPLPPAGRIAIFARWGRPPRRGLRSPARVTSSMTSSGFISVMARIAP